MKSCNIMMKQKTGIAALNLVQCGDSRFLRVNIPL